MDHINTDIDAVGIMLVAPRYTADDTDSLRSPSLPCGRNDPTPLTAIEGRDEPPAVTHGDGEPPTLVDGESEAPGPIDSPGEPSTLVDSPDEAPGPAAVAPAATSDTPSDDDAALTADITSAASVDSRISARQAQKAATRSMKEALITQAELVAMTSPSATAAAEMKALMAQWKTTGRTTKTEDDALWARFNTARDQLFTRLDLLRQQRRDEMAEAKRAKDALIATAEEVAQRADLKQATETMTSLMAQWKLVGPAPDDKGLWLRFKAAQDTVYQRRHEQRQTSQSEQRGAAEAKRSLIAEAEGLIGSPDLRAANARLRDMQAAFREAGYAGRDLNRRLSDQFHAATQDFYRWMRREPVRRRDSGEQPTYGRRSRIVHQINQVKADIDQAEATLRTIDSSGAKRSHGSAITLTLGQVGAYSDAAADAMRLKIRLTDLEGQLARLDASLRVADRSSVPPQQPISSEEGVPSEEAVSLDEPVPSEESVPQEEPMEGDSPVVTHEPEPEPSPDPA